MAELAQRVTALEAELQAMRSTEPLIGAAAAAALLGLTPKALLKRAQRGTIPSVRVGRLYRFRASDLTRGV